MGKRTSYGPGTFSWVDVATPDPAAALSFYSSLFGWEADAEPGYTTLRLDGDAVAGLFTLADDQLAAGAAPRWTSYVTVEDADATAARAAELGGHVIDGPFDVVDAGRTVALADPEGALVALWQPAGRIGAERVNDVGCLTMNELPTSDLAAAARFYGELFGWTTEVVDTGPGGPPIRSVMNRGSLNATFSALAPGDSPHWRPYFTVGSIATTVTQVGDLGGAVVLPPLPIGDGSIAVVLDPQGAELGLFEGDVDP
jgi:predicted enzyme related to lactoylglutathione lyase